MARQPIALEVNYKEAKALLFRHGFAGSSFSETRKIVFTGDTIEKKSAEIIAFLREHYGENPELYFNLPGESVFIREVTLPFLEKKKVKEILPFELEGQLSHELNDIVYDYYTYPDLTTQTTRAIVLGIHRELVEPYLRLFRENGIRVLGLYAPMDALFHLSHFSGEKTAIILHVSSLTTMMLVVDGHDWIYSRTIPMGYDLLLHWISRSLKLESRDGFDLLQSLPTPGEDIDFDFYKRNFKVPKNKMQEFLSIAEDYGNKLSRELELSLKSAPLLPSAAAAIGDDSDQEAPPVPVLVSSDLPNQKILEELIARTGSRPVKSFPYEKTPMAALSREFSIAVGGAISQAQNKGLKFLRGDLKKLVLSAKEGLGWQIILAGSLALFFFAASFFIGFYRKISLLKKLEQENVKLFESHFYQKPRADISAVSSAREIVKRTRDQTQIYQLFFRSPRLSKLLSELNRFLTSISVEVESLTYNGSSFDLAAKTTNFADLENLKKNISESPYFRSVTPKGTRQSPGKNGERLVKFNLEIAIADKDPE